jgi:hypothetical protein
VTKVAPSAGARAVLSLVLSARAFRAAQSGASASRAGAIPTGTRVRFALNVTSAVGFTVDRLTAGVQIGRSCRPLSGRSAARHHCTRRVQLRGSFTVPGRAGNNAFEFTGRLSGRKLAPGNYDLVGAPAADAQPSASKTAPFTIVR